MPIVVKLSIARLVCGSADRHPQGPRNTGHHFRSSLNVRNQVAEYDYMVFEGTNGLSTLNLSSMWLESKFEMRRKARIKGQSDPIGLSLSANNSKPYRLGLERNLNLYGTSWATTFSR